MKSVFEAVNTVSLESSPQPVVRKLYFFGPTLDGLLMGGFSIFLWVLWCLVLEPETRFGPQTTRVWTGLMLLIVYPYFGAIVLSSFKSRSSGDKWPVFSAVWSVYCACMLVFALLQPERLLPALCSIGILCLALHLCLQLGRLSAGYLERAGIELDLWIRLGLSSFPLAALFYPLLNVLSRAQDENFVGIVLPLTRLALPSPFGAFGLLLLCLALVLQLVVAIYIWLKQNRFPPLIAYAPFLSMYLWLDIGVSSGDYAFGTRLQYLLVFHGLQGFITYRLLPHSNGGLPMHSMLAFLALGFALFVAMPWVLNVFLGYTQYALPASLAVVWMHHAVLAESLSHRELKRVM